jgi:enoyl-CoA hydratase/carnithine racemase
MSIDFDLTDGIATITINRPERMNAMDAEHYKGLSQAWTRVRDESAIRVAIITGAGEKSFSAGADIKSFLTSPLGLDEMWLTQRDQLLNRGLEVWKPVIAAVNGYCLAGGMTLLLGTDIRVAAEHATFNIAEVKRGLLPGNGGTQRILEQLPHAIGMELLLTGDSIDAHRAAHFGLINKVVPKERLMDTAREYAKKIAANAPLAVQAAKEMAVRGREMDRTTGLRVEALTNRLLQFTEDAKEGPAAFAEKRPPNFKGR